MIYFFLRKKNFYYLNFIKCNLNNKNFFLNQIEIKHLLKIKKNIIIYNLEGIFYKVIFKNIDLNFKNKINNIEFIEKN
ncbi:hypothetical protein [Candidatus Vidania fulgoroideorum]